ncbi:uncharacterized protein LOC133301195 isoform X2 [Gastrolobium bilobum]|uniref:uncharacterized protein LOC133301195 isoform X2 n=1 Tax=Gastrolobium bilobum TaxID=150636 RepID=UPI002AB32280|nr:uncharacterized protein LOC133301195 isoform X2 [Gastrolobium bilobum]
MDEFHSPNSLLVEDEFESTLHSAPSFAIYNNSSHGEFGDDDNDPEEVLKRTALIGQSLKAKGNEEFSFVRKRMDLIEEGEKEKENENENENDWSTGIQKFSVEEEDIEPPSPPMYLATGLGVGSDNLASDDLFTPNLQESEDLEEYYKRMVDEYPCHPLILKKYAQFLQANGELQGAEEYFLRATQADPNDGEILMQYAKLVWEQHHDIDRTLIYFERAAQAAPQDSHVLAAYASFLWETEDDENEGGKHETQNDMIKQKTEHVKPSKEETGQEIDAANLATDNYSEGSNVADYFKKMTDENPHNPLFLKKYAQFLFQSKRDLQAAEDYYSRAILADPSDGEMMSDYAKLEWELHHDLEKTLFLFEQAVQAAPENSNVLAAHACFLWETEDGES